MAVFNIPDDVIAGVAVEIHTRTNRDYQIPVVGVAGNMETPQIFEIMPPGGASIRSSAPSREKHPGFVSVLVLGSP